uniref:Transposase n=1 Tax=Acrobeloides nanus TaxID=290746 RepID=A0A914C4I2_9BILA
MKEFRRAIIRIHERGVEKREIGRLLGIHEATVRKAIKCFEETESNAQERLSPLDYSVWSILEEKACAKSHQTVESLKRALRKAWNEISVDTLRGIVDNFSKMLKKCIDANGGHFE